MTAAILVIIAACAVFWLVFFRLKLLRLTPGWGIVFAFVVLHLFLVFLIGLRFVTPNSANATMVQRTIQLIPRLPEPTLVTAVLVEENVLVKKDQPLFQFDRRPYQYKVEQIEAQLAVRLHQFRKHTEGGHGRSWPCLCEKALPELIRAL
jgi:multidrug resistance efflux pump